MDCSPPGSSVSEILQARILEWVAIPFSRGSSQSKDWTWVSCTGGRLFTICTTLDTLKADANKGWDQRDCAEGKLKKKLVQMKNMTSVSRVFLYHLFLEGWMCSLQEIAGSLQNGFSTRLPNLIVFFNPRFFLPSTVNSTWSITGWRPFEFLEKNTTLEWRAC